MRWNLQSNASDILGLGPRAAGRLATVGIRTVSELLAAKPIEIANRLRAESLSQATILAWQNEAELLLELPELPVDAARLLAAAGFSSAKRIQLCTPTELLAHLESSQQRALDQNGADDWLAARTLPSISEVSEWIFLAEQGKKSRAA